MRELGVKIENVVRLFSEWESMWLGNWLHKKKNRKEEQSEDPKTTLRFRGVKDNPEVSESELCLFSQAGRQENMLAWAGSWLGVCER